MCAQMMYRKYIICRYICFFILIQCQPNIPSFVYVYVYILFGVCLDFKVHVITDLKMIN